MLRLLNLPPFVVYIILFIAFFMSIFFIVAWAINKKPQPKPLKYFPPISFIIPSKNVENVIKKCLLSIINQDYLGKINIFVVNDASTDNTVSIVEQIKRKFGKKNREIIILNRLKSQGIKAPVTNFGLKYIKDKYVAVIDADTFISSEIITKSIMQLENDSNVMGVTTPLLPCNKGFLPAIQKIEYIFSSFYRYLLGRVDALAVTPAFSVFRYEFFRKYGGFDEKNWTEDFEMALRIRSKFYKLIYLEEYAGVIVPETIKKLYDERVRWGYGTFQNLVKYKYMMQPKYGLSGTFYLPVTALIGILTLIFSFFVGIYQLLAWTDIFISNLLEGWAPSLYLKISWFDVILFLSDPRIILGASAILISVLFFIFANKLMKQKINIWGYLFFLLVSSWFYAYTQLIGLVKYLFKIKIKWGEKMHQ